MARLARMEVFAPDEIAIVHVMNRVVRRCFLLGTDPVTGKNFDHRKEWIEQQLQRLAACFGIDLLAFSILSNHFHLILRSRPDVVSAWDDREVARRWLMLCPLRKEPDGAAAEPNSMELNAIANDPQKLKTIRLRLSDIGWWMRCLSQQIAIRANREDNENGRFWQGRYRAVRLLDEAAVLACAAYVDLNPIRAAMAETLEQSDFTSVQRRIQSLTEQLAGEPEALSHNLVEDASEPDQLDIHRVPGSPASAIPVSEIPDSGGANPQVNPLPHGSVPNLRLADRFLSPLRIDERHGAIGPDLSPTGYRCSNKGFLPFTVLDYLELLDWTARQLVPGKQGSTPRSVPPILERLNVTPKAWIALTADFGNLFSHIAGRPQVIDETRSRVHQHRFRMRTGARDLLTGA